MSTSTQKPDGLGKHSAIVGETSGKNELRKGRKSANDDIELRIRNKSLAYNETHFDFLTAIIAAGSQRARARTIAEALLTSFCSLPRVLSASREDILSVPGVSKKDVISIQAAYNTILDSVTTPVIGQPFVDHQALITLVLWTIGQSLVEKVQLICLDKRNIIIGTDVICTGSEASVSVTPRTIIMSACRRGARSIIVAHNHPGGRVEPSNADIILTRKLEHAAELMEMRVLDHIIVAAPDWFSFKKVGYL
jgi:DNA repair protein RadC